MATNVVLDGALFSECQLMGSNRSGMLRLTEDITTNLLKKEELNISFANSVYSKKHDRLLRGFLADNYPSHNNKVLSKRPFLDSERTRVKKWIDRLTKHIPKKVTINDLERNDIFHSFYYPFSTEIQQSKIQKTITYLDIIPLRLKGYHAELIETTNKVIESIIPNYAISISEFSRHDLLEYDKRVNPDRVFVSPLAASTELFFQNKNKEDWKRAKEKYGLPDNYFLSLSGSDQRRNLPHLIKSFSNFVQQQKPKDLYLVLTGNFNHSYLIINELQLRKEVKDKIIVTDRFIDNEDLSVVYSNAHCFFFMSVYEGFGLPVLEAMQCGTPVICTNATSLPEIVGDAGFLLPPSDEDALCDVMNRMYLDESLRNQYAELGLQRAKQFSWERCANEYAAIFKKIADSN